MRPLQGRTADDNEVRTKHSAFDRDKFLLLQKRISLHAKYYVWDEDNRVILFVERPVHWMRSILAAIGTIFTAIVLIIVCSVAVGIASEVISQDLLIPASVVASVVVVLVPILVAIWLSPKRHVNFYRDDTRIEPLLHVVQENKNPITARFTVTDAAGTPLARLRKNYLYNFIRRRWTCHSPDGQPICLVLEDSMILSLMRRVFGSMIGLLRTNFIILAGDGSDRRELGQFNRKFTLFDRYVLDMSEDHERALDRRLAVAIGVMLDTGERR